MNVRSAIAIHCLAPLAFAVLLASGTAMAATPAAAPAAGAEKLVEVEFDALVDHVGEHVRVTTTFLTVRDGVLTGASSIAINVKLDDRGIVLGMPRETVAKVELLGAAPAAPTADPK